MSSWISEEDSEDFEQEKRIKEWLENSGRSHQFEYEYINSKGNARSSFGATISLDSKIGDDEGCTLSDFIAGSDGRDLECGLIIDEPTDEPRVKIVGYLLSMGFEIGEAECLIKILKSSEKISSLHFAKLAISLEL